MNTFCRICIAFLVFYFICTGWFSLQANAQTQYVTSPPPKAWVSLGYSSLDSTPPNWAWLRRQLSSGYAWKSFHPIKARIKGIIIPVFDDGRCFYQTQVSPFAGRNQSALSDERALTAFLKSAREAGIPVFLGLDVLGWQKSAIGGQEDIFANHPELKEISSGVGHGLPPEALYASPFNGRVRSIVLSLTSELAHKFPDASGIAVDLRLSNQETLGFSEEARAAAINDISIDPIDLVTLRGGVDDLINKPVLRWIEWRNDILSSLLAKIKETYQKERTDALVLVSGTADYYSDKTFSDLRTSQDWMRWIDKGVADGVLLEGRWLPRFEDRHILATLLRAKLKLPHVIPLSGGSHLVGDSDFYRDWTSLTNRLEKLQQIALLASSDKDLHQVVSFISGRVSSSPLTELFVNERVPEFTMKDSAGKLWESRSWRGTSPTLIITMVEQSSSSYKLLNTVLTSLPANAGRADKVFVVSSSPLKTVLPREIVNLVDTRRDLISFFGKENTYVYVDEAGFVRKMEPLKSVTRAITQKKIDNTSAVKLEIGKPAPQFRIPDMNGNTIQLSDFYGKKNLLITFFPKCFTGGCAGQLASLKSTKKEFDNLNTEIVAVSVDAATVQKAFASKLGVDFRFIPDTGRNVCFLYDAVHHITELSHRQSVLIDKRGIVRLIDKHVDVTTHGKDILNQMKEMKID